MAPSGGGGGGARRFCGGKAVGGEGAGPFEGIMGGGATITSELLFTSLAFGFNSSTFPFF